MKKKAILFAILAAAFYALSTPFSKILMTNIPPSFMAGFLYLGAGFGMFFLGLLQRKTNKEISGSGKKTGKDFPYIAGMILLDIIAPVLLMIALFNSSAANISLINNFEIVATSIIAFSIFKEKITAKLWIGIVFITTACILLSFEPTASFTFTPYSLFAILACIAWGFENNCTRKLSSKDPIKIVIIKGIGSGTGAVIVGLLTNEHFKLTLYILFALLLGFIAYGLSVYFYIRAQKDLGAAKTSAFYGVSPFIGTFISLLLYKQLPNSIFFIALILMILGTVFASK